MKELQINRYGKIIAGEDAGCYLLIEQEDPSYEDYLVIVSDIEDPSPFPYGHDNFLQGHHNLLGLFEDNNWEIKWLTNQEEKELNKLKSNREKITQQARTQYNVKEIQRDLHTIRDLLYTKQTNESTISNLENILQHKECIQINATKHALGQCLKIIIPQIQSKDYISAARILYLVCALPYTIADLKSWSTTDFAQNDLIWFLMEFKEIKSNTTILRIISKAIHNIDTILQSK